MYIYALYVLIVHLNPCDPNPCQNLRTCIPDLTDQTYICLCDGGFTGTNCEGNIIFGGFCFYFFFIFIFILFFDYTICVLFINGIENKQHNTAQFQKPLDTIVETELYSIYLARIWMIAHWSAWHMYGNEKWRN